MCAWDVFETYGNDLLFSGIGRASSSALIAIVFTFRFDFFGPVPQISTIRPVFAHSLKHFLSTPKPRRVSLIVYLVFTSANEPSGYSCILWRRVIIASISHPALIISALCFLYSGVKSVLPGRVNSSLLEDVLSVFCLF